MHTLRKFARTAVALVFLAAVSDVIVFHAGDTAKVLRAAVANISPRFFEPAIAFLTGLALLVLLIFLRWLASRVASFVRYLWAPSAEYYAGLEPKDRITLANDLRANQIQVVTTVVQALGGIAVLIGIYFAWANLKTTQEAQKDTQKKITDRFTKAIDQLGRSTQLELRLGGIYALERIARDSEKDHWPIMEVLTTFVRVHAPVAKTGQKQSGSNGVKPSFSNGANPPAPAPDIQAILTVIGRRDASFERSNERLNLAKTNLMGADLSGAHLSGAHLSGADLSGADLSGAHLSGTHLRGADLSSADLSGAHLSGADLRGAYLSGADLSGAHLRGSGGLTQSQVNSAQGNKYTVLPSGIAMPESWKQQATPTSAPTVGAPKSP